MMMMMMAMPARGVVCSVVTACQIVKYAVIARRRLMPLFGH
jgi:hypothetical protein